MSIWFAVFGATFDMLSTRIKTTIWTNLKKYLYTNKPKYVVVILINIL